jgi:hypothetical protein
MTFDIDDAVHLDEEDLFTQSKNEIYFSCLIKDYG